MPSDECTGEWEPRALLSNNLLQLVDIGAVQSIGIHFSPTLVPRLREEEEKLLQKWFSMLTKGDDSKFGLVSWSFLNVILSHE